MVVQDGVLYLADKPPSQSGSPDTFNTMQQRNGHQSAAHGKLPKYHAASDPAAGQDYDPRKRFDVSSPGQIWVSQPATRRLPNARWSQASRTAARPGQTALSALFEPPHHAQSPPGDLHRGRTKRRKVRSGPRGAAPLAQPSAPAASRRSPSLTGLPGPVIAFLHASRSSLSPAASAGASPRLVGQATSSSADPGMRTPTAAPLGGSSASKASSAQPDHSASYRESPSRSPNARNSPILGDTAFLYEGDPFGGWTSRTRSASASRPDVMRGSASLGRLSERGDGTPGQQSPSRSPGSIGSLFGGSPRKPMGASPLSGSRGSPPPMARYRSPSSDSSRSSSLSFGGIDRAFDEQRTTSRQQSLSPSSTGPGPGPGPGMAHRSPSAPPASSPLRQPPLIAQSAIRFSTRLRSQQQQQQRTTSASRLASAPSNQRPPTQSPSAPSTGGTGRRPALSSSPAPAAPSQGHQAKKPRRR